MSMCHILGLKLGKQKVESVHCLEHLHKFNLNLCIPRYSNSPQVSGLGMNRGRGWNPNLDELHLLEYSESKGKT